MEGAHRRPAATRAAKPLAAASTSAPRAPRCLGANSHLTTSLNGAIENPKSEIQNSESERGGLQLGADV